MKTYQRICSSEIDRLINPVNYIGCSAGMIARVVRKVKMSNFHDE